MRGILRRDAPFPGRPACFFRYVSAQEKATGLSVVYKSDTGQHQEYDV